MKNKRGMLHISLLLTAALTAISLAACGAQIPKAEVPAVTAAPVPETTIVDWTLPAETTAPAAPTAEPQTEAHAAYRTALTRLLNEGILPDGTGAPHDASADPAANQFAVQDIDGDGRDELLLIWSAAPTAGQTQFIFDYDGATKQLRTEFSEYPLLSFYDNGVIRADWSHNQGLAGAFWPFTMYRYDAASDAYQTMGMVDAWDRNFTEIGEGGAPFPTDADTSGTGIVYYIMKDGADAQTAPVDASVYDAWLAGMIGGATEISIPYTALTQAALDAMP